MIEFIALAASAVNVLTPLLMKALEKGAEKVGENATDTLFSSLRKSYPIQAPLKRWMS